MSRKPRCVECGGALPDRPAADAFIPFCDDCLRLAASRYAVQASPEPLPPLPVPSRFRTQAERLKDALK